VALLALAAHEDPEVRQLIHRPDGQPAAPLEELAPLVGERRPVVDYVGREAAVEHQVVGAGDDDKGIELEILHRPHRRARALEAAPAPAGPQSAAAHDVAARGQARDLDGLARHAAIVAERTVRPWQVLPRASPGG